MRCKKSAAVVALICAGVFSFSQAQNARIGAMGGASIVPDFSRTLYNPAIMNDYKDFAEINFGSGAIMGTKSAGKAFSIGAVMNRGLMLNYFYDGAEAAINAPSASMPTASIIPNTFTMQYFPHILWGIDLNTVQIGFDTYLEWDRATYDSTSDVLVAFQEIKEELTVYHPGVIAGFKFNMSSASLMLHMGGGLPTATGTRETRNIPFTDNGTSKLETESGIFGRGGFEVNVTIKKTELTIGADGRYEKFQFSTLAPDTGAKKVRSNKTNEKTATPYLGATAHIANGLLLVGMGRSIIDVAKTENDAGTISTTEYDLRHALIGGFEKQFPKLWKFDSLALRGGVSWGATSTWTTHESTPVPATVITSKPISTLGPAYPYLGFGISRNFFCMDLLLNPGSWNSAFVGPAVSRVTISLRY
jgi:hypothetical protein